MLTMQSLLRVYCIYIPTEYIAIAFQNTMTKLQKACSQMLMSTKNVYVN
jgi:hypothetical protein